MASEWEEVTIADIAADQKNALVGGPFGSDLISKDYVPFGVPVIRGQNMGSGRWVTGPFVYVSAEKGLRLSANKARPQDIVFTQRGTLGQVAIVPEKPFGEYIVSQSQMKLTVNVRKADPLFVYYALQSPEQQEYIRNSAIQTGVPHTNLGILKRTPLDLPSLREQQAIAALLSSLDERIECLRSSNVSLEATARAIFKSWFVDFDPVRAKAEGREPEGMDAASAALFPSEFQESATGPLPTGWVRSTLGTISTVGIGKTPPRAQSQWFSESDTDVVWVSIRDMGKSGTYITTSSEFLTREAVERFNVRLVPDNTVILSFKLTVGRVAISDGVLTTNEAIAHCVLGHESPVSTEFLYCALSSFDFSSLSSTSSIAEAVNSKSIREVTLTVPSKPEMDGFTALVRPIFERVKHNQRTIANLTELRDTLLPRLISGKLRVPGAEKLVEAVL